VRLQPGHLLRSRRGPSRQVLTRPTFSAGA